MLPPIGIWKDIRLEGYNRGRIDDVHLRQVHNNKGLAILAEVKVNILDQRSTSGLQADLIVTTPSGEVLKGASEITGNEFTIEVQVDDPLLWWPNGYGDQYLYEVSITLKDKDNILDDKQYKFGLRTIELRQEEDEFGKSFQFVVNGVPIFAKGSNWIPADSFLTRFSDEIAGETHRRRGCQRTRTCCGCGAAACTKRSAFTICVTDTASWSGRISSFRAASIRWTRPISYRTCKIEVDENVQTTAAPGQPGVVVRQQRDGVGLGELGLGRTPIEDNSDRLSGTIPRPQTPCGSMLAVNRCPTGRS